MAETLLKPDEILASQFETELSYENHPPADPARLRLLARLGALWEERRFLTKAWFAGLAAALTLALVIPPQFESTVQLMPPDQQTASLASLASLAGRSTGTGALAGLAGDLLGQRTSGDLFVGVLESRTVRSALVTKFDLRKVYKKKLFEDAGKRLSKQTEITLDKKSGIITITVADRSPQRAAEMAQEYVNQLDWVMTQLDTSSAHREREFLEGRLQQVSAGLETAERDFSVFASENAAVDIPEQGKAMVEAASTLEGQLIAAQTELQGLKEIYADDNVRVRSMQARVEELQHQIEKLGGKPGTPDDSANAPETLYPSIRRLPLLGVRYADLLRNTRVQEAVFEALTQEYELAKVAEAKEIPSVKVLDAPNIAERKSSPPRRVITIVGTLLVFSAAAAWILARDRWREIDRRDPTKAFAMRVYRDVLRDFPRLARNGVIANQKLSSDEAAAGSPGTKGASA
jgi:capsule polysaccharide export protein KpsE/RkpR